jgi:hypothetical protein
MNETEIHEDLNCLVCMEIALGAYGCSQCGTLVCAVDFPKFKPPKCPVCNVGEFKVNHFARRMIYLTPL